MVFVHGFTQAGGSWTPVIELLPPDVEAVAVEVPDGLDFASTANVLGRTGGRAIYVGYSMGGRLCLQLALDQPEQVTGLVLVSASPGIADATERAARQTSDEQLARDIERDGVDAFLERWLALPLFASLPAAAARLDERRAETVARLTHQLRELGQGAQPSLWERLPQLRGPVHLVTGGLDTKYTRLATDVARHVPHARVSTVAGAGHAVHLEQPAAVAHLLTS
jgi:2-succinyl-6-hydroxy-2,4-cyclohexadiene-1-carboxylate synthase